MTLKNARALRQGKGEKMDDKIVIQEAKNGFIVYIPSIWKTMEWEKYIFPTWDEVERFLRKYWREEK